MAYALTELIDLRFICPDGTLEVSWPNDAGCHSTIPLQYNMVQYSCHSIIPFQYSTAAIPSFHQSASFPRPETPSQANLWPISQGTHFHILSSEIFFQQLLQCKLESWKCVDFLFIGVCMCRFCYQWSTPSCCSSFIRLKHPLPLIYALPHRN